MKKINIYILMVLLLVGVVFSAPPTETFAGGLTLEVLSYDYHPLDTDYYLHTHLYNTASGVIVDPDTVNCSYHVYSEATQFNHVLVGILTAYGAGMSDTIDSTVFNETGDYAILLWCEEPIQTGGKNGGFVKYFFTVYEDDKTSSNYFEIISLIAIVLLLVVALVTGINVLGIVTSIGIIIYGLTFILSSILIGTLVLTGGLLLALYFATRQAE